MGKNRVSLPVIGKKYLSTTIVLFFVFVGILPTRAFGLAYETISREYWQSGNLEGNLSNGLRLPLNDRFDYVLPNANYSYENNLVLNGLYKRVGFSILSINNNREAVGFYNGGYTNGGGRVLLNGASSDLTLQPLFISPTNQSYGSVPRAISNAGEIVGSAALVLNAVSNIDSAERAVYYPGYSRDPESLPQLAAAGHSAAYDIASVGKETWIVGYAKNDSAVKRAVLWRRTIDPNNTVFELKDIRLATIGTADDASVSSVAFAVNNKGQVAGMRNDLPVIYDMPNKRIISLAPSDETIVKGATMDINDSGDAVGWYLNDQGVKKGFLFKKGAFIDLNTLIKPQYPVTAASTINNAGGIMGYAHNSIVFVAFPVPEKPLGVDQIQVPLHLDEPNNGIQLYSAKNGVMAIVDHRYRVLIARESNGYWRFEKELPKTYDYISTIYTDGQRVAFCTSSSTLLYEFKENDWVLAATFNTRADQLYLYQDSITLVFQNTAEGNGRIVTYYKSVDNWVESDNVVLSFGGFNTAYQVTFSRDKMFVSGSRMLSPLSGVFYGFDGTKWAQVTSVSGQSNYYNVYSLASNENYLFANLTDGVSIFPLSGPTYSPLAMLYGTFANGAKIAAGSGYVVANLGTELRIYKNQTASDFWSLDYRIKPNSPIQRFTNVISEGNRVFASDGQSVYVYTLCEQACPELAAVPFKAGLTVDVPADVGVNTDFSYQVHIKNENNFATKNNILEIKDPRLNQATVSNITGDIKNCVVPTVTPTVIRCTVQDLEPGATANIYYRVRSPQTPMEYRVEFLFVPEINILNAERFYASVPTNIREGKTPVVAIAHRAQSNTIYRFPTEGGLLHFTVENWFGSGVDAQIRWQIDSGEKTTSSNAEPIPLGHLENGPHKIRFEFLNGNVLSDWTAQTLSFDIVTIENGPRISNVVDGGYYWRGLRDLTSAQLSIDHWGDISSDYTLSWMLDGKPIPDSTDATVSLLGVLNGEHTLEASVARVGSHISLASTKIVFHLYDPFDLSLQSNSQIQIGLDFNRVVVDVKPVLIGTGGLPKPFYIEHTVPDGFSMSFLKGCQPTNSSRIVRCAITDEMITTQASYRFEYKTIENTTSEFTYAVVSEMVDTNGNNDIVDVSIFSRRPAIRIITPIKEKVFSFGQTVRVYFEISNVEGIEDNLSAWWSVDNDSEMLEMRDINDTTFLLANLKAGTHEVKIELRNRKGDYRLANTSVVFGVQGASADPVFDIPRTPNNQPYLKILSPANGSALIKDDSHNIQILFETDWVRQGANTKIKYVLTKNNKTQPPVDVESRDAITLDYLEAGEYRIELYVVDENGTRLTTDYAGTYCNFSVVDAGVAAKVKSTNGPTYSGAVYLDFLLMLFPLWILHLFTVRDRRRRPALSLLPAA